MSVMCFSDEQIKDIYENLSGIICRSDSYLDIGEEELFRFLVRVGICNRLAYEYNYHKDGESKISIAIPDLEASEGKKMSLKELIKNMSLLEYNCVTNSGRCFLDSGDKRLLEKVIHSLRLRYIDALEKNQLVKP